MKISILCSDPRHPIYPYLKQWGAWASHDIELVQQKADLSGGDILFLISCHEIIHASDKERYKATLVIHASDLPMGRGWSPHIWQILEGKNHIIVSLIEAQSPVDTGAIWAQRLLSLKGHELSDEINEKLFTIELGLMDQALEMFVGPVTGIPQDDQPGSYYRRRTPEDSRLDPSRSIAEQFDLLRVADWERFPAFFDLRGHRYLVRLEKKEEPANG